MFDISHNDFTSIKHISAKLPRITGLNQYIGKFLSKFSSQRTSWRFAMDSEIPIKPGSNDVYCVTTQSLYPLLEGYQSMLQLNFKD